MAIDLRRYNQQMPFERLPNDVQPGQYHVYRNVIPEYVPHTHNVRGSNTCVLIVSSSWSSGVLKGIEPCGPVYPSMTFRDDDHGSYGQHFNANGTFYFRDSDGQGWCAHSDGTEHLITAVATGTSYPCMAKAFRIPQNDHGELEELFREGTYLGTYPNVGCNES